MTTSCCGLRATPGRRCNFIHDLPADLVLVDLELADNEGFGLLSQFKEHPPQSPTIIIALAAADDTTGQLRAFELGAHDCLTLPEEPEVCRARLLAALQTKKPSRSIAAAQSAS